MKTWLFVAIPGLLFGLSAHAAETMTYEEMYDAPKITLVFQSEDGMTFVEQQGGERIVLDQYGRWLEGPSGAYEGDHGNAWLPEGPLSVGLSWKSIYVPPDFVGTEKTRTRACKVMSANEIHVTPAGSFSTWKVECYNKRSDKSKGVIENIWFTNGAGGVPPLRLVEYHGVADVQGGAVFYDILLSWKIDGVEVAK